MRHLMYCCHCNKDVHWTVVLFILATKEMPMFKCDECGVHMALGV